MKRDNYLSQAFCDLIDKMELSDLEGLIIGLAENRSCNAEQIDLSLGHRKFLLYQQFECSPENVARFGQIMLLLKEQTAMIFDATKTLYRQLHKQLQGGDTEWFRGFDLETSVVIEFDEDTESKYFKMAEVLDCYYSANWGGNLVETHFDYDPNREYKQLDEAFFVEKFGCHYDDQFMDDWAEEWFKRDFPLLNQFPIPYAAHQLLFHANYALQDVVRIKGFDSTIKVTYQL